MSYHHVKQLQKPKNVYLGLQLLSKGFSKQTKQYIKPSGFFITTKNNNYRQFEQDVRYIGLDKSQIQSVSFQCSGHGSFKKIDVAERFLKHLKQTIQCKLMRIKNLELRISGFDLNLTQEYYQVRKKREDVYERENVQFSFIDRLLGIINLILPELQSFKIRINSVHCCRIQDLRNIISLVFNCNEGLNSPNSNRENSSLTKLKNLSFQLSDWNFQKIQAVFTEQQVILRKQLKQLTKHISSLKQNINNSSSTKQKQQLQKERNKLKEERKNLLQHRLGVQSQINQDLTLKIKKHEANIKKLKKSIENLQKMQRKKIQKSSELSRLKSQLESQKATVQKTKQNLGLWKNREETFLKEHKHLNQQQKYCVTQDGRKIVERQRNKLQEDRIKLQMQKRQKGLRTFQTTFSQLKVNLFDLIRIGGKDNNQNRDMKRYKDQSQNPKTNYLSFLDLFVKQDSSGKEFICLPNIQKFRFQLSTLIYTEDEYDRFQQSIDETQFKDQKFQLKGKQVKSKIQYFHYTVKSFISNIINYVMPNLNEFSIDMRNWYKKLEMNQLKEQLVNIHRNDQKSLQQLSNAKLLTLIMRRESIRENGLDQVKLQQGKRKQQMLSEMIPNKRRLTTEQAQKQKQKPKQQKKFKMVVVV